MAVPLIHATGFMLPSRPILTLALVLGLACHRAIPEVVPAPPSPPVEPVQAPAAGAAIPVNLADTVAGLPPLPATPADPARVYQGWKLFHIHCFRCHGFDAEGGGAPDLRFSVAHRLTRLQFVATVISGRPARGMPTWGEVLNGEDAAQIYEYIVERSTGRLPPGKPPRPE